MTTKDGSNEIPENINKKSGFTACCPKGDWTPQLTSNNPLNPEPTQLPICSQEGSDWPDTGIENTGRENYATKHWREYFSEFEMEAAYNQLNQGIDPNDEEGKDETPGSDSNPSEDNLEKEELQDFYQSLPQKPKEPQPIKNSRKYEIPQIKEEKKLINPRLIRNHNIAKISPAKERLTIPYTNVVPSIVITSSPGIKSNPRNGSHAQYGSVRQEDNKQNINENQRNPVQLTNLRPVLDRSNTKQAYIGSSKRRVMTRERPMKTVQLDDGRHFYKQYPQANSNNIERNIMTEQRSRPIENEEPMKNSANFRMAVEQHTCSPTININIKSLNINTQEFADPYHTFDYGPDQQSNTHTSRVIASIPRHDESETFQKLFAKSDKYEQERIYEYYQNKKREKFGSTLSELLTGTMLPLNVRDYVQTMQMNNPAHSFEKTLGKHDQQNQYKL